MATPVTVKKYGNRRLYDTAESRYVTLEELATKVRGGTDVVVVDAKTGADLTQATLTQIIVEGRGAAKLLPVPLLFQLVRMGDDALGEFLGRWMSWTLALYQQARTGARSVAQYNPLAMAPFTAASALARLLNGPAAWGDPEPPPAPQAAPEPLPSPPPPSDDVAALRRELDEIKRSLARRKR